MGSLPLTLFFFNIWKFFISNNYFYYRVKPLSIDKINKTDFFKKLKYGVLIKWNLLALVFFFGCGLAIKSDSLNFFWNHFVFTNFRFWFFIALLLINFLGFFFFKIIAKNNLPHSVDFFFALINLASFMPIIFSCNTFFTFLFVIELVSVLLFYKFVVSKVFFKNNNDLLENKKKKFIKLIPRQYLSVLFFQFWSNFFSTVLIFMAVIVFFAIFGTTEWVSLRFLFLINTNVGYIDNHVYYIFILIPLLIGIFFKLGMSPLHLYKIEVYKGLPFITVFFYTTYFFFSFVTFFSYLIMILLDFFNWYWVLFLSIFFVIGAVIMVCLLFDVQYVKAFFAYSTVINVLLIFLIVILYFNN